MTARIECRFEEGFQEKLGTALSELLKALEPREDLVEFFHDGRLGRVASLLVDEGLKIGALRFETAETGDPLCFASVSLDLEAIRAALRTMDLDDFLLHEGPP